MATELLPKSTPSSIFLWLNCRKSSLMSALVATELLPKSTPSSIFFGWFLGLALALVFDFGFVLTFDLALFCFCKF